jgi:hypothetical protein
MRFVPLACALLAACSGAPAGSPNAPERTDQVAPFPDGDGGSAPAPDDVGPVAPAADPCAMASLGDGAYCGQSLGGDAGTLYHCAGGKTASTQVCALGCHVAPPGVADYCEDGGLYHLPWRCDVSYPTTQGNNGDICGSNGGDHTGVQAYAWDFGIPRHTPILAARAGTITVAANVTAPGQACYDGCTQPFGTSAFWTCCNGCLDTANHVNVQHADGTVATYYHLDLATAKLGDAVAAGDVVGYSGTSGCSSGPHLHFQVMGDCPSGYCQSIAISFAEAGVPACGDTVKSENACVP